MTNKYTIRFWKIKVCFYRKLIIETIIDKYSRIVLKKCPKNCSKNCPKLSPKLLTNLLGTLKPPWDVNNCHQNYEKNQQDFFIINSNDSTSFFLWPINLQFDFERFVFTESWYIIETRLLRNACLAKHDLLPILTCRTRVSQLCNKQSATAFNLLFCWSHLATATLLIEVPNLEL